MELFLCRKEKKPQRISNGSSSLWDVLDLDNLSDKWANFYKYL